MLIHRITMEQDTVEMVQEIAPEIVLETARAGAVVAMPCNTPFDNTAGDGYHHIGTIGDGNFRRIAEYRE